jgi:hypothetical protein
MKFITGGVNYKLSSEFRLGSDSFIRTRILREEITVFSYFIDTFHVGF